MSIQYETKGEVVGEGVRAGQESVQQEGGHFDLAMRYSPHSPCPLQWAYKYENFSRKNFSMLLLPFSEDL